MKRKKVKVYQVSETEYFAGVNTQSVRKAYFTFLRADLNDKDVAEILAESAEHWRGNNLKPVSDLQMEKLTLRTDDNSGGEETSVTFAAMLKQMITDGDLFPMIFCQSEL